jgi:hypothetical protein
MKHLGRVETVASDLEPQKKVHVSMRRVKQFCTTWYCVGAGRVVFFLEEIADLVYFTRICNTPSSRLIGVVAYCMAELVACMAGLEACMAGMVAYCRSVIMRDDLSL